VNLKGEPVVLISMLSYFFVSCWSFLVPLIQKELGFLYSEIGLVVAVSTLASLLVRLALGRLADRIGFSSVLRLSLLGLFFSNFLLFISFNIVSFTAASTLYLLSTAMIYWTSMLAVNPSRRSIGMWLSLTNLGGFFGFIAATIISALFGPRMVFASLFFLPLLAMRFRTVEVERKVLSNGGVSRSLLLLSAAGFLMVFHASMWSSFLPIYLNNTLPRMASYASTGLFLACDSLFFAFVFYLSGKAKTRTKGAAMVAATTVVFTLIVSALPLLPLAPFLLAFLVVRNVVIAFRMIGVAEMVKEKGFSSFQTQFYSTFANSAAIFAPVIGGLVSDSLGLDYIFYLSAPFGLLSALLFAL